MLLTGKLPSPVIGALRSLERHPDTRHVLATLRALAPRSSLRYLSTVEADERQRDSLAHHGIGKVPLCHATRLAGPTLFVKTGDQPSNQGDYCIRESGHRLIDFAQPHVDIRL